MIKKYKTSYLIKVFTLGLYRYGYKIDSDILTKIGLIPRRIQISSIDSIQCKLQSTTYFYILTDKRGKKINFTYSTLDGDVYQDMFKEILKINPKVKLTYEMQKFLDSEIAHKTLKFDFNVHKGDHFTRDRELSQQYPSLDAFIGFTISFIFLPIPIIFGWVGKILLINTIGTDYHSYRLWAIVISGIALTVTLTNLFISLVSMYLGHRLTFISIIITILGLCIGLLQ